jgi:hypothetical protein
MFERSAESQATGRYRVDLVSGETRQKSHQKSVQETLDEGRVGRLAYSRKVHGRGRAVVLDSQRRTP